MAVSLIQSSLSAGEISPELYGQVDLAKAHAAATTLRGMVVSYRGGAFSRGGFAVVGVSLQTTKLADGTSTGPPRLIPFQFSIVQGFSLELGDNYLRFVFQGGYVLETPLAITGVTQADPAVVSATNTYADGDWVFVSGVVGMTELNGNTYIVAGASGASFQLNDLNGNPVDATAFGAYASGGTVARLYTVTTPYAAVDLPYLKYAQSADVMSLTCSNPVTQTEYPPYDLVRLSAIDWTLTQTDFTPAISAPATCSAAANTQAPSTGVNATFAYVATAVDKDGNESIASPIGTCHGADIQVEAGSNTITCAMVTGAKFYNFYRAPPATDSGSTKNPVPAGSIFGFVGSSNGTQFVDNNAAADLSITPPTHQDPFAPGQILAVDITSGGSGLTTVTYAITTAGGSGFAGYPVVVAGALAAFPVTNGGQNYLAGDSIAFNGAGFASGAIAFGTTNPAPGDTITLNGVVWTFVAAITGSDQTLVQGALSATLTQLVTDLSASGNPALTVANYSVDNSNSDLLINYKTAGVGGNAYTLAASVATPSGATLTGGGGTGGTAPTATLVIGPDSGTYPGVSAYFQQRRFYANSLNDPDTVWASQTGRYKNFDTSIPTIATDAITASPWTEQVNGIQWLIPMPGGLIAMTGNRAWQIVGEGSYQLNAQPVTPSTTQAQPQAFNGCSATIQPIVIDYDVIYVEAIGNTTVRDLSWNFWVNIYTGSDLTILSSHLFLYRQIVQWTWARLPYKVLWACCNDGTMLSMTYLKEQEVYGWARHDTLGLVVSVTSVTEPPVNAVYVAVQRFPPYAPNGIYTIERMDNRIWQSVEDAYAVDSGVSNPMVSPAVPLFASSATGAVTLKAGGAVFSADNVGDIIRMGGGIAEITAYVSGIQVTGQWVLGASLGPTGLPFAASGAWTIATPVTSLNAPHLAGMTVVGLADGVPIPLEGGDPLVVGPTGTVALPFAASNVKVGLPFLPQIQTPYLNAQGVTQGARKVIPAVTVRLASSAAFQWGTNQPDGAAQNPPELGPLWSDLTTADLLMPTGGQSGPSTYTSPGGQEVTQLWTGDIRVVGQGAEWDSKGQVAIQQPLPLALEVVAVMPEILDGDVPERGYSQQPSQRQQGQPARGPGRWMLTG